MDWITDAIAIGNFVDAKDVELLKSEKIASALSLDGTLYGVPPRSLGLRRIEVVRIEDAIGNPPPLFLQAVNRLDELVRDHSPVLVQCHAGRSRSVVVVAGHLMRQQGLASDVAIALVVGKREAAITAGLERLLAHL